MKRFVLVGLGLALVGSGLFVVSRYRATRDITMYLLLARPVEENAREGSRLGLEPVAVGPLRALVGRPSTGHAWFIFWGGNSATYFHDAVAVVEGFALPPEVGVLIVAPPGYDSEGHPSPAGLEHDAELVRAWVIEREGAERVVVGGFSMGTYSALVAAEAHVAGVVLVGASTDFGANDPGLFFRLKEPTRYVRREQPPRVPALVIQGDEDVPWEAQTVATWLGARLVLLPHTTHPGSQTHPVTQREAHAFIVKSLELP